VLVFWAYFIRIAKRNNFVEDFFQFEPFFAEKTQFENSKKGTGNVVVKNGVHTFSFLDEKGLELKKNLLQLFLFSIRTK
jgi:hypothetical protein